MDKLLSLKISLDSFLYETEKIHTHLQNRSGSFDPGDIDIDYRIYCRQYVAIRQFVQELPHNDSVDIIKERVAELPEITEFDFRHEPSGFSWHVVLPIIGEWLKDSFVTNKLQEKMEDIYRSLNTVHFMLKALTNSQVIN